MFAELASWITDAGSLAAAVTAVLVVLGLLTRAKPVRWVWRQLIGDPVGRWAGGIVSAQVDPVRAELKELSTQLVNHMGAEEGLRATDLADRDRRQSELDAWRTEMSEDVGEIKTGLGVVHRRIDSALQRLADGNPEVRPEP